MIVQPKELICDTCIYAYVFIYIVFSFTKKKKVESQLLFTSLKPEFHFAHTLDGKQTKFNLPLISAVTNPSLGNRSSTLWTVDWVASLVEERVGAGLSLG